MGRTACRIFAERDSICSGSPKTVRAQDSKNIIRSTWRSPVRGLRKTSPCDRSPSHISGRRNRGGQEHIRISRTACTVNLRTAYAAEVQYKAEFYYRMNGNMQTIVNRDIMIL